MDLVYVVPGIMGSELYLHERQIWPPVLTSFRATNPWELLDPDVEARSLIFDYLVLGFYEDLTNPLRKWGYPIGSPGPRGQCIPWPYNWVKDVRTSALALSQDLAKAVRGNKDGIVLLAHSMGGLICTYALECLAEGDLDWRERVRLFVTFGTPFRGAPEALLSALGKEGTFGISAQDCMAIMADTRFPSAYQLLPHAHCFSSWEDAAPLKPITNYQQLPNGEAFGSRNLDNAMALQRELLLAANNPGTRKFNFCGSEHATAWAATDSKNGASVIAPLKSRAGDGTVPAWSGRQNDSVQFAPLGDKHSRTFGNADLLRTLRALLLTSGGIPPSGGSPPRLLQVKSPGAQVPRLVELAKNMVPDHWPTIDARVMAPPEGGLMNFAWFVLESVETIHDVRERVAQSRGALQAQQRATLDKMVHYPTSLVLEKPTSPGLYALLAWTGEGDFELSSADPDTLEYLWCFLDSDQGEAGPTRGESGLADEGLERVLPEGEESRQSETEEKKQLFEAM